MARLSARLDAVMAGTTGCLVAADGPVDALRAPATGFVRPSLDREAAGGGGRSFAAWP